MPRKLKILLWIILAPLGLFLAVGLFAMIMIGATFYHLIPDVSHYPRGICFSARGDESYDPLDWNRPQKTYNQVRWERKKEEGKPQGNRMSVAVVWNHLCMREGKVNGRIRIGRKSLTEVNHALAHRHRRLQTF